jgi:hypothetical protein
MMLEVMGVRTESLLRLQAVSHSPQRVHFSGSIFSLSKSHFYWMFSAISVVSLSQ